MCIWWRHEIRASLNSGHGNETYVSPDNPPNQSVNFSTGERDTTERLSGFMHLTSREVYFTLVIYSPSSSRVTLDADREKSLPDVVIEKRIAQGVEDPISGNLINGAERKQMILNER